MAFFASTISLYGAIYCKSINCIGWKSGDTCIGCTMCIRIFVGDEDEWMRMKG